MKIATNVHRDAFGGIAISNLALFDWLQSREDSILGIEFTSLRSYPGAVIFRKYEPKFFRHHIINCFDVLRAHPWEKVWGERFLRMRWAVLIDEAVRVLQRENPDVVLVNGTYFASWILSVAAEQLHIPVVLRYAGVLQQEILHYPAYKKRRLLAYERSIVKRAHSIIFPSRLCQTVVERDIIRGPAQNAHVVYNPVGAPRGITPIAGSRTIAAIGRWTPIKNFQDFVRLHQVLEEDRWKHTAAIVTSSSNIDNIVPPTVQRVMPMEKRALQKYYATLGMLIVPSHFETFCNVAAEAAVIGVPVLVSKNVGFSECLIAAGLKRMVIPSFKNIHHAARVVKSLCGKGMKDSELSALRALLDPHAIHRHLVRVLRIAVESYPRAF